MTLTEKAYLEIDGDSSTATFELQIGLEHTSDLTKSYLMGERGQYVREIVNSTPYTGNVDEERRTGYWIDGGAGDWQVPLSFESGLEDTIWGDGSGGDGPSNVTKTDASGANVPAISRKQILQNWIAVTKSDSTGQTRIHVGEWTNGNVSGVANFAAGAFGEPMPVAVRESSLSGPDPDQEPGTFTGNITFSHVALWGSAQAPAWASDAVGAALNAADYIPDA